MKTKSISWLSATTLALCGMFLLIPHGMAEDKKSVLTADDEKFVKQETAAGMGIAKIADLAAKKSSNTDIKAFAEMLATDHAKANLELKELAASKGVEPSTVIAPAHAETYQELEKASGAEFDKEFLKVAVSSHKKCVSNFEEASKETKDNDLKMWVDKMLPGLKSHLAKAEGLNSTVVTSVAKSPDNTEVNARDRDARTLTPLDQGSSKADVNATAQIRKEIIAGKNMSVNAQNVKIITKAGKVTLRGPVSNAEEKRLIGEIADRIVRSENVDNQLEIQNANSSN